MIPTQRNPFHQPLSTLDKSRLTLWASPANETLYDLIHECSQDSSTRTVTAAATAFSLWQLRSRMLSEHVPSVILLNAGEETPDPIDDFIRKLVYDEEANRPGAKGCCSRHPIQPEHAQTIMERAVREQQEIGKGRNHDPFSHGSAQDPEERYRQARKSGYGYGWSRVYSQAWTESFGLLTDDDTDSVILRIHDPEDRKAFHHDLIDDPERLLIPRGIGCNLLPVRKTLSVSGSLTNDLWNEEFVLGIIKLGLPVVFLPHNATEPLTIPNIAATKLLPHLWRGAKVTRAKTSLQLPPIDWFEIHTKDVRRRLHLLPGNGTYEFAILQLLHQLGDVCNQIAHYAGDNPETTA